MLIVAIQYPEMSTFGLEFFLKHIITLPGMLVYLGTVPTTSYLYICSLRSKALLPLIATLRRFKMRFVVVTTLLLTAFHAGCSDMMKEMPVSTKMVA